MNTQRDLNFRRLLASLIVLTLALTGCASKSKPALIQSKLERVTTSDISPDSLAQLVDGNNTFALDFYRQVRQGQDGNLIASPYSISLALAMAYGGARGQTAQQMAEVLHFSLPAEQLHSVANSLNIRLISPEKTSGQSEDHPQLNIANSIWLQKDFQILPDYLDLLAQYYGTGLHTAEFAHDTETTRKAINEWVARETQENIKDILPEGGLDPNTRLVLANAIYFKAKWVYPFVPSDNQNGPFTLLDGTQVPVPTMKAFKPLPFPYTSGDGFQAVVLPYQNSTIAMILLVPDMGRYIEFESSLTWPKLQSILASLHRVNVDLGMPKFDFETSYQLNQTFSALGMTDAFDASAADFSGITGKRDLYIGDIRHKAFITVDEYGTVAGAATMVAFPVSETFADVELTIDRPFLFAIQDQSSGTILFLGRVLRP